MASVEFVTARSITVLVAEVKLAEAIALGRTPTGYSTPAAKVFVLAPFAVLSKMETVPAAAPVPWLTTAKSKIGLPLLSVAPLKLAASRATGLLPVA